MNYTIKINDFEGPFDLLLHLIKQNNLNINDLKIDIITKQYLNYIEQMENLNLTIASEYLVMAAELIEMKSSNLLPDNKQDEEIIEEDPREQLIRRLIEYQRYKDITNKLKEKEKERNKYYTKRPEDLSIYQSFNENDYQNVNLEQLLDALKEFMQRKEQERPLNTKIATKEYSVQIRSKEIMKILSNKKKVEFTELFDIYQKDYIIVTFLSILNLAKKQELKIKQDNNFNKIYLLNKGCE